MHGKENGCGPKLSFCDLPNELLIHVLIRFQTLPLLQLRLVSHRFQNIIFRIVHQRLLLAASLEDRKLILECYHPSAQYTEPYVFCEYLGTPGLSDKQEGQGSLYQDLKVKRGQLKHLYSRFLPSRADVSARITWPHPAGDVPGSRTYPTDQASTPEAKKSSDLVTHRIFLDAHELFTQLSITAALVEMGPRRGVFLSFIDITDKKTPRIWRDWLSEKAKRSTDNQTQGQQNQTGPLDGQSDSMIWVDQGKTLGLRVRVKETKWRRETPILIHKDEDQAISYTLEFEESVSRSSTALVNIQDIYPMFAILAGMNYIFNTSEAFMKRDATASHD
ncbi:MAG: hypothetical protein Q9219_003274 [cf. Caloplaca sp. 3 TL-2023]